MTEIATQGEAMGFDYLTMTDHVVLPDTKVPGYPYSESGEFYEDAPTERHEQLIGMAYIAAKTTRIRLVAAVLVVPHRPAVLAAKMLATLDVLSRRTAGRRHRRRLAEDRVRRRRHDAVSRARRGDRRIHRRLPRAVDRALAALRRPLHASSTASCSSPSRCSSRIRRSGSAARAAPPCAAPPASATLWYPIGSNNQHLLDTLPRLQAGIARLRKATADAGRDPASVGVGYRVKRYGAAVPPVASDGERRLFSGSEADIIGDLRALRDIGVTAIDIDFGRPDAAAVIAEMRRFRAAVIEKI